MRKRIISTIMAALVAATVAAVAANTTFFTSIGDQIFPFSPPNRATNAPGTIDNMTIGATIPQVVTATQVNGALGAYAKNPASDTSYPAYTFSANQTLMIFDVGSTNSYAYFTLNANPYDGQQSCIFTAAAITTLYVYANAGQTIVNAATSLAAQAHNCYVYSLATKTWDRSQ